MLKRLLTFRYTAITSTSYSLGINGYRLGRIMADRMVKCTENLSQQTDLNLKNYIKNRMLNVADAHIDDLTHSALVGFATELQLIYNNNIAGGTQNTPHIVGLAKFSAGYIVGINEYFNESGNKYRVGKLDVMLGSIEDGGLPGPRSDELVDINNNKNNNDNSENKGVDLNKLGDLSALADMDVEKINAIAGLARIFQNAPAIGIKDKDGRNKKKRRLNNNNNNSYNTVCINNFLLFFPSLSVTLFLEIS